MKHPTITIGKADAGDVQLDVLKLVDTRCLIQANSGGGKSWLLRRIAEQTAGQVQCIILDPEGEFVTLREKLDLVIVGKEGEVPCEPRSAGLLCRRLVELQSSAVIDLFDLKLAERRRFVRLFLETLIDLPKTLWNQLLVMIDEAHLFCPERSAGESEATEAVIGLMSQGRKRGFCGMLATQRLSKLHKDAEAEANNVFIGRTWLDIDQDRAGKLLGKSSADRQMLRELDAGDFYAFGPAINVAGVAHLHVGPVTTTHPKAGERHKLKPPQPSDAVRKIAGELKDLPQQADEEAKNLVDAKKQIAELKREMKKTTRPIDEQDLQRKVDHASRTMEQLCKGKMDAERKQWVDEKRGLERKLTQADKTLRQIATLAGGLNLSAGPTGVDVVASPAFEKAISGDKARRAVERVIAPARPVSRKSSHLRDAETYVGAVDPKHVRRLYGHPADGDLSLGKCERAILTALYWLRDEDATKAKVAFYSGYSSNSSGFDNGIGRLRSLGLAQGWRITPDGETWVAGTAKEKPSGSELREWLRPKLGRCENALLDALLEVWPERLSNQDLAERSGYSAASSGFDNGLGKLRTIEAAAGYERDGGVKASDVFQE